MIETSESSGLLYLGFKGIVSLGVKFDRKDRVAQVGIFEVFPQHIEFGRRYIKNQGQVTKTEQGKFANPEKVFPFEKERPNEAIRFTEEYFKCGTNFKDIFFKTTILDEID